MVSTAASGKFVDEMSHKGLSALLRPDRRADHGSMHPDHHAIERLSAEECVALLRTKSVGRVGLSASSLPFVIPVRYVLDRDRILMRTGRDTKMAAATDGAVVAFEVDEFDDGLDEGWSVLVQGFAREVLSGAEVDPASDEVLRSWVGQMPARCFSIPTEVISGHRLLAFDASPCRGGSTLSLPGQSAAFPPDRPD